MAGSLQDQLLNMGVASKEQAKKAKQSKRKKAKQSKAGVQTDEHLAEAKAAEALTKAREEKIARDRELNRQREEEREKKEKLLQAGQIIQQHAVSVVEDADVAYNFSHGKTIKKIYVEALQQEMLAVGTMAVACLDEKYLLLPGVIAERVAKIAPDLIASHHEKTVADEDDPYKDYEIPDDLMW